MTAVIADVLDGGRDLDLRPFNGFGGLQGGVVAAVALREMRAVATADLVPTEITAHLVRPVTEQLEVRADVAHEGRSLSLTTATVTSAGRTAATATAVLSASRRPDVPTDPGRPPVVDFPLDRAERFAPPPEFVPISTRMELRLATTAVPFSGSPEPRLCAWIRLTERLEDPWERLLVLADALPPSFSAVLTEMRMIPTVRTTVRFTPEVATADAEWVLVEATTADASSDGWHTEEIRVWTPEGVPLATSSQLRTIR
ncbi:thioesterase family protein [Microbacterium sp.]|uniref:thioesterase family protein n=1 Tax=Microbacterium sp. TaxID=51671 RepID=UPI0028AE54EB|nr:thioesterase family protein [Microbacterium sp.]